MIYLKIELDDARAISALDELIKRADNLTPLMRNLAGIMHDAVEENFAQEGRPPWAPLSPVTLARRRAGGAKILQDTGGLAVSVEPSYDADSATVSTNKIYGPTQQFGARKGQFGKTKRGAPIPWGDIPPRPFFALGDDSMQDINDAIADYFSPAL